MTERIGRCPGAGPSVPRGPFFDFLAAILPRLARFGAEEGVSGPTLAADQRFEQESERRPVNGGERGDRSQRVGGKLADYWNDSAPCGEAAILVKRSGSRHI